MMSKPITKKTGMIIKINKPRYELFFSKKKEIMNKNIIIKKLIPAIVVPIKDNRL
jgi:hypothetical protein